MNEDIKSFLDAGGVSAKFPKIGHAYEGTVLSFRMEQQSDYDTGKPAFWDNGSPKMHMILTLATDAQGTFDEDGNPKEVPNDDGERNVYVKGPLQKALGKALRAARSELQVGGWVRIERAANLPKTNPKFKAPYGYTVEYKPANQNSRAATEFLTKDQDPAGSGDAELFA